MMPINFYTLWMLASRAYVLTFLPGTSRLRVRPMHSSTNVQRGSKTVKRLMSVTAPDRAMPDGVSRHIL